MNIPDERMNAKTNRKPVSWRERMGIIQVTIETGDDDALWSVDLPGGDEDEE